MNKNKALVVFSGGQDSTTCLFWAIKEFEQVHAIIFDYGQRHAQEIKIAQEICQELQIVHEVLSVPLLGQLGKNSLTHSEILMDKDKSNKNYPNTFVPGRNLFFLSIAAVRARENNISHIVTGVGETDFSGYPDCRDAFIKSLNVTLNLAMDYPFVVHTPLMWLNKAQIWELSHNLGVFDFVRQRTLTCYNGIIGDGCGECPSCRLRKEGLEDFLLTQQTE